MYISGKNRAVLNLEINYILDMSRNIYRSAFKTIIVLFLFTSGCDLIYGQGKFSLSAGWGFYEATNIGAQWNISEIASLSVYGGTNFGVNSRKVWTTGISFGQTFKKPIVWKLRPGYSLGLLYWTSDDELYYFKNLSFPLMIGLTYPFSEKLSLRAEGGAIFTSVIQSDRKQNVEAGYPDRHNGNVRFSLIYKLGVK
jgi:hypothetical protein